MGVEGVLAAIDDVEVDVDAADDVAALVRVWDQLTARVTAALSAFNAVDGWGVDGALSLAAWLRGTCGLSGPAAHRLARTARRLRELPAVANAWREGELQGGHVEAICANVTDQTLALFQDAETSIVVPFDPQRSRTPMTLFAFAF